MGVHNVLAQIQKATARGGNLILSAGAADFTAVDGSSLILGTDDDVTTTFDGTNVQVLPATDDVGAYHFGDGATDLDVKMFLGSTTEHVVFDVGDSRVIVTGVPMYFGAQANAAGSAAALSSSLTGILRSYADDGGASVGTSSRNILGRTLLTVDQSGGTIRSVQGQLKMATGVDVTTGIYTALQGYVEMAGTHVAQTGATFSCIDASMEITTSLTIDSGGEACGIHIETTGAGTITNNGTCAALLIDVASGAAVWPVGIQISPGAVTKQALIIGTGISTPLVWTGDSLIEWHGRLSTATTSDAMFRCRASAPASTNMTNGGAVVAGQFQAYGTDTSDVAQLNAIQGHCGIKANCEVINSASPLPDMVGGWFKIEDLGFDLTLTGPAAALVLGTQFNAGTTLTGVCDWMFLMKEGGLTGAGGVPDAIIRGYDGTGGGLANFLLDIPASLPWDAANSSNTQSGKIAVNVGGATKYIQTYSD